MSRSFDAPSRAWLRPCLRPLLLIAAVGLFVACDPPSPDGTDLGIAVTDAPTNLAPGEDATVSVTVTNHGTITATSIYLYHATPEVFTVTGLTGATLGNCATHDATFGACELNDLAPDDTTTVTVALTGNVAGAGDLTLWVNSDGTEPDPDPHANTAVVPLTVDSLPTVDLEVTAETPFILGPGLVPPDTPFTSRTWVTNRGPSAASEVEVSQEITGDITILDARFQRALPGGGEETGSCTIDGDAIDGHSVTCTTDGIPVAPTTAPDERWVLEVDAIGELPEDDPFTNPNPIKSVGIVHTVSSPHPEPEPDPSPNTTTSSISIRYGLLFDPVPPVDAGTTFTVDGVMTGWGASVEFISVGTPVNIEPLSVTFNETTFPCQSNGTCPGNPLQGISRGDAVSIELQALTPGPPGVVWLSTTATSGVWSTSGAAQVQVVHPSITSELHPTLAPIDDAPIGIPFVISGAVHNTGSTAHTDVAATIEVPVSLEIGDVRWGIVDLPCPTVDATVTCNLGTVPAYSEIPITLTVTPTATGTTTVTMTTTSATPQDDPDPFPDTTQATFEVLDQFVDLGVAPTSSSGFEGRVDDSWAASATITNHGNVAATGVQFAATLPDGLPITSATIPTFPLRPPDAGTCTIDSQEVLCPVGTIPPGAAVRVSLSTGSELLDEQAAGTVELAVTSDQPEPTPDPNPNAGSWDLVVLPASADLSTQIVNAPSSAVAGQPADFRVRVRNLGPSVARNAVVAFEAPAGWTIADGSLDLGGDAAHCTTSGATFTCEIETWTRSGPRHAHITAIPDVAAEVARVESTTWSDTPDPNPDNNDWGRNLTVHPLEFDLGLAANYNASPQLGSTQNIDFQVSNTGPADAEATSFTTTLPASVQIEATPFTGGFTCDTQDQTVTCTHPMLPPGTALIRLQVTDLALGESTFTASVAAAIPDNPDTLPNTVEVTRTVVPVPGSITGTVTDLEGDPVGSTQIRLYRVDQPNPVSTTTLLGSATNFSFTGLAPGDYQVWFIPHSWTGLQNEWFDDQPSRDLAATVTISEFGSDEVADATLAPEVPTVVEGQVIDDQGQPVAGVVVGAYRNSDSFAPSHQTTTAPDGTYSLTIPTGVSGYVVPIPDEYKIRFGPPAGSGLLTQWWDNKPNRATADSFIPTHRGQVISAHATLATAP